MARKLAERLERGEEATPVKEPTREELIEALRQWDEVHEDMFVQCCSNPVKNVWGKQVDMTKLNMAHQKAQEVLRRVDN